MVVQTKCAIITGGASGYGKALAIRLIEKGYNVVIGDINEKHGAEFEQEMNKDEKRLAFFKCDVRDEAQLKNLLDKAIELFGSFNVMVNNAGIAIHEPISELGNNADKMISTNLTPVIKGTSLAINYFTEQIEKNPTAGADYCIINSASLGGLIVQPAGILYSITKAGILALTEGMAPLKEKGIRVNSVAPSFTMTNLQDNLTPEVIERIRKNPLQVSLETVVDGMIRVIEDTSLAGRTLTLSPLGQKLVRMTTREDFMFRLE